MVERAEGDVLVERHAADEHRPLFLAPVLIVVVRLGEVTLHLAQVDGEDERLLRVSVLADVVAERVEAERPGAAARARERDRVRVGHADLAVAGLHGVPSGEDLADALPVDLQRAGVDRLSLE